MHPQIAAFNYAFSNVLEYRSARVCADFPSPVPTRGETVRFQLRSPKKLCIVSIFSIQFDICSSLPFVDHPVLHVGYSIPFIVNVFICQRCHPVFELGKIRIIRNKLFKVPVQEVQDKRLAPNYCVCEKPSFLETLLVMIRLDGLQQWWDPELCQ